MTYRIYFNQYRHDGDSDHPIDQIDFSSYLEAETIEELKQELDRFIATNADLAISRYLANGSSLVENGYFSYWKDYQFIEFTSPIVRISDDPDEQLAEFNDKWKTAIVSHLETANDKIKAEQAAKTEARAKEERRRQFEVLQKEFGNE